MNRNDRRELGFLGALLLGWALVAAQVVHQFVGHSAEPQQLAAARALPLGAHGHSHRPSAPHAEGSLEHGQAFFSAPPAQPQLVLVLVNLTLAVVTPPTPAEPAPVTGTAQPQGP